MDTITINEDVTSYSNDEIASLITAATERRDALFATAPADITPAQVAEAKGLVAGLERLAAERDSRASAAAEMDALREATVTAAEGSDEDEADEDEDSADEDDESDEDDEQDDDAEDGDDDNDSESEEDEDNSEGGAVTASTTRPVSARKRLARKNPKPQKREEPKEKSYSLVAAADVNGFAAGQDLPDIDSLTAAVMARAKSLPSAPPKVAIEGAPLRRFPVATLTRTDFSHTVDTASEDEAFAIIAAAGSESRLEGGNLIAAGGWCAPSEINYDLCDVETTDGLVDLPTVNVKRGGMRYTSGPDFSDLYDATGIQTEAQAIAGTEKTCYEVDCPPFSEVRLDAVYLCLKFGFLQNAAYPELTKNVVKRALIAHEHRMSADTIARMQTLAGTALVVPDQGSTAQNTLSSLELIIEVQRGLYRLGITQTLEVVLPHWVRAAIRADYALRTGVDLTRVSDADLAQHFAVRGARVQWVYNWQALPQDAVEYPATFDALVYPAGAYVRGTADVVTLENVYDAAELSVNRYTGLFTEQGNLVVKNCLPSKRLTIPVCGAGRTGIANIADCKVVGV